MFQNFEAPKTSPSADLAASARQMYSTLNKFLGASAYIALGRNGLATDLIAIVEKGGAAVSVKFFNRDDLDIEGLTLSARGQIKAFKSEENGQTKEVQLSLREAEPLLAAISELRPLVWTTSLHSAFRDIIGEKGSLSLNDSQTDIKISRSPGAKQITFSLHSRETGRESEKVDFVVTSLPNGKYSVTGFQSSPEHGTHPISESLATWIADRLLKLPNFENASTK